MRRRRVVLDSLLYRGDAWLKEVRDIRSVNQEGKSDAGEVSGATSDPSNLS